MLVSERIFDEYYYSDLVTEFAKKTGDYASLSATDIKLMALVYQMEIENVGRDHLKSEPVVPKFEVNSKTARVMIVIFSILCHLRTGIMCGELDFE